MKIDISMITKYIPRMITALSWWMDQRGFTVRISRIDKRFILCIGLYRTTNTVKLSKIDTLYRYSVLCMRSVSKKYLTLVINSLSRGGEAPRIFKRTSNQDFICLRIKRRLKNFKLITAIISSIRFEN